MSSPPIVSRDKSIVIEYRDPVTVPANLIHTDAIRMRLIAVLMHNGTVVAYKTSKCYHYVHNGVFRHVPHPYLNYIESILLIAVRKELPIAEVIRDTVIPGERIITWRVGTNDRGQTPQEFLAASAGQHNYNYREYIPCAFINWCDDPAFVIFSGYIHYRLRDGSRGMYKMANNADYTPIYNHWTEFGLPPRALFSKKMRWLEAQARIDIALRVTSNEPPRQPISLKNDGENPRIIRPNPLKRVFADISD